MAGLLKMILLLLILFIQGMPSWGNELCSMFMPEQVIVVNPDTPVPDVCYTGEAIRLKTTISTVNKKYEWVRIASNNNESVVATNSDYVITSVNNIGRYKLRVYSPNPNEEAVPNGDFENVRDNRMKIDSDNSGDEVPVEYFEDAAKTELLFTTDYKYVAGSLGNELYGEGTHRVGEYAKDFHSNFCSTPAHSGTKFLIANGASNQTTRVWFKQVHITPNTRYAFSVWGLSVHPSVPAKLAFFVTDNAITSLDISNGIGQIGQEFSFTSSTTVWTEFFVFWDSGEFSGIKTLTIVNTNIASSGNDFAIDDVSFCGVNTEENDVSVRVSPSIIGDTIENIDVCEGDTNTLDISATDDVDSYSWTKNIDPMMVTTKSIDVKSVVPGNFTYVGTALNVCGSSFVTYNLTVHPQVHTRAISHN